MTSEAPPLEDMVQTAARWKGASLKADRALGENKRARLAHSRLTTKADLDRYLIRTFNVDEATARSVSNELTRLNIPADESADVSEFAQEPWALDTAKGPW